jgi:hypothetical protein
MASLAKRISVTGLAAAALFCAAPAGAQPDFQNAPVTAEMTLAAINLCAAQVRAGAFDHDSLTKAGWVPVISAEGDPVLRGFRHPDNMILLTTFDSAEKPDKCVVMAPTGHGLTLDSMRSAIREQTSIKPKAEGERLVWELDDLTFGLKPMGGNVGVVIDIDPRKRR